MTPRQIIPALLVLGALLGMAAGPLSLPPPPTGSNASAGSRGDTRSTPGGWAAMPPAVPSMPPAPPSPMAMFRQVLQSSAEEQRAILDSRSPKHRAWLEEQIHEFSRLSPAEREARLRLLELRFYLLPLLGTSASNRVDQLRAVPARYRAAVQDRLGAWDALSSEERAGLLDDHAAASWLCRSPVASAGDPGETPMVLSEPARLETTLARWQRMSPAEKTRMVEGLERFFQFDAPQKDRTLREMTRLGRTQVADLMTRLDELPPSEREKCLRALERFAGLPESERQRFLQNAVRWATMTEEQRRAWRDLQAKLPPLPPVVPPQPPLAQAWH
ncbi:MAG: DUF3106 domain-containing protein [Verrucomicrobiales bacterium]|nr:DUF3106 domain-containing protein [Verrucomicrobiales bacterium]